MAVITRTVIPGGGGDYTLLSQWEAAEQTDLVADGDSHVVECHTGSITDECRVEGWGTSATNTITIKAAAGHEHGGDKTAGFIITKTNNFNGAIHLRQAYVIVQDIHVKHTADSGSGVFCPNSGDRGIVLERLIAKGSENNNTASIGILTSNTSSSGDEAARVYNCLVYDSYVGIGHSTTFRHGFYENNTVVDSVSVGFKFQISDGFGSCVNNWAHRTVGGTADYQLTNSFATATNNASGDSSAPGTAAQTLVLENAVTDWFNGDYTPVAGQKLAGNGTSPALHPTDITGATRNDPDDIGAYAAAGGPTPVQIDPDDLTQNQTLDNVTVTFTPAPAVQIDPADLSQNQTLTNVTLTYVPPVLGTLAVHNLSQDQTLTNVTLTYEGVTIGINDLSQDQTVTRVEPTFIPPAGTIAPAGVKQNQTITNVTITSTPPQFAVTIDSLSQDQRAASVFTTYTPPMGQIAPEYMYQQQQLDNVTLSFVPALVSLELDDITQQQYLQSVRFGGLAEGSLSGKVEVRPALTGQIVVYY